MLALICVRTAALVTQAAKAAGHAVHPRSSGVNTPVKDCTIAYIASPRSGNQEIEVATHNCSPIGYGGMDKRAMTEFPGYTRYLPRTTTITIQSTLAEAWHTALPATANQDHDLHTTSPVAEAALLHLGLGINQLISTPRWLSR